MNVEQCNLADHGSVQLVHLGTRPNYFPLLVLRGHVLVARRGGDDVWKREPTNKIVVSFSGAGGMITCATRQPGSRAEVDDLRLRLELLDASADVIAVEIGRQFGYRPRQSYRLARGWEQREAAQRYNTLVQSRGCEHTGRDSMTPSRVSEFERWPTTSRKPGAYVLLTLAELYRTVVANLLDAADLAALSPAERAVLIGRGVATVDLVDRPPTIVVTDSCGDGASASRPRRRSLPLETSTTSSSFPEDFVTEAADQSIEAATRAEATNVGSSTVPMLERTVDDIAHAYERGAPLPLFRRTLGVRNQVLELLEGRQHPNQTKGLYAVAGSVCALLAWMSGDFAQHAAALSQADAAWVFAEQAGHDPVRAWVRTTQAKTTYWAGNFETSAEFAHDGLRYATGTNAVLLASMEARAQARVGVAGEAAVALRSAAEARQAAGAGPGGLFGCTVIGEHCFAAGTHLTLGDTETALVSADAAEAAFAATPVEERSYNSITMARINATVACVLAGDLNSALQRIHQVVALPPEQRLDTFAQRLHRADRMLGATRWRGNPDAAALREQIIAFRAESPAGR